MTVGKNTTKNRRTLHFLSFRVTCADRNGTINTVYGRGARRGFSTGVVFSDYIQFQTDVKHKVNPVVHLVCVPIWDTHATGMVLDDF